MVPEVTAHLLGHRVDAVTQSVERPTNSTFHASASPPHMPCGERGLGNDLTCLRGPCGFRLQGQELWQARDLCRMSMPELAPSPPSPRVSLCPHT